MQEYQNDNIGDCNNKYFNYFAIASMMNPVSLANREIFPTESFPGEIIDFKIQFFGQAGMAEAIYEQGQSFHGVVHKLNEQQMNHLDSIESTYLRVLAKVKLYDGNFVDAYVYTLNEINRKVVGINKPPSERYRDIMVRGSQHYGVKQDYIDWLKSIEVVPRTKPENFLQFQSEHLPYITYEQLAEGNGQCGNPTQVALNGKIIQYDEEYLFIKNIKKYSAGKHLELYISKILYDPYYGTPEKIEDFTREHCAAIEDWSFRMTQNQELDKKQVKVIGRIFQIYKD